MQRYIAGRVVQAIFCIMAVSVVIFLLSRLSGDPVDLLLETGSTMEDKLRLRHDLGLDKSLFEQYWIFFYQALTGNLGISIVTREPVTKILFERGLATFQLGIVAFGVSLVISVLAGVYSAVKRGTFFDLVFRVIAISGQSIPVFWLGLMLMLLFGVVLGILPTSGAGGPEHLILPSITLGWYMAAGIMRITRNSMLEVLGTEYIQLARAKGVSNFKVIWLHGFKNAALPVMTFSVLLLVMMLGGAVVTETVFTWPGLGRLVIQSVMWRDYPVVQGAVLLLSTLYILANLFVDVLYAYLNPKIRYGG